jgi:hypothetical protein
MLRHLKMRKVTGKSIILSGEEFNFNGIFYALRCVEKTYIFSKFSQRFECIIKYNILIKIAKTV